VLRRAIVYYIIRSVHDLITRTRRTILIAWVNTVFGRPDFTSSDIITTQRARTHCILFTSVYILQPVREEASCGLAGDMRRGSLCVGNEFAFSAKKQKKCSVLCIFWKQIFFIKRALAIYNNNIVIVTRGFSFVIQVRSN